MIKVKALESIVLRGVTVGLTQKQANRRLHQLNKIKANVYEVVKSIDLKAGEEFKLDSIPKFLEKSVKVLSKKAQSGSTTTDDNADGSNSDGGGASSEGAEDTTASDQSTDGSSLDGGRASSENTE